MKKLKRRELKRIQFYLVLFKDSDKLYYIDSWIDDLCDLTWDQVVEKLSEDKTL